MWQSVRDKFYAVFGVLAIEVQVLLSVCGFEVDIYEDLAIFVFKSIDE